MSTKRTMSYREAKRQFIWWLRTAIWGSQILEEPRIVSHQRKWVGASMGKKREVHAGLYKLFTKTWNWRINWYYTYKWVVEHISSLMRERCIFFSPEKNPVVSIILWFCNSATIQWLIWVFSQSVILLVNCLSQPLSLFTCTIYSSEVAGIKKITVGDFRTRSFPTSLLHVSITLNYIVISCGCW